MKGRDFFLKKLPLVTLVLCAVFFASNVHAGYMRGKHYTLDQLYRTIDTLGKKDPWVTSIEKIGDSVEGRPIYAIKLSKKGGGKKPEVLVTANIHGVEFTGDRVALAICYRLIKDEKEDPWIESMLDRMDFYFVPLVNPDGYAGASRHLDMGLTARRTNANGVDLNRNYPYPKGVKPKNMLAGSRWKLSPNYMGKHPLSESETIAMDKFVGSHNFFTAINFHTTGSFFVYPWAHKSDPCPDREAFVRMGETFREHQTKKYTAQQSYAWYQTVGDFDDWMYARYGALSVTVEVAKPDKRLVNPIRLINPFWWYNPVDINSWVLNDRDATLHAIEKAFDLTGGKPLKPQPMEWELPAGYRG